MQRVAGRVGKTLLVLACVAYQYLAHRYFSSALPGQLHVLLIGLPFAAIACWIAARSENRLRWFVALSAAGAAVWLAEIRGGFGLVMISGVSHTAIYSLLLWHFGRTLVRGAEPMVTRFARQVHGAMQPKFQQFTRGLTIAWCVFFLLQLIVSASLLALAPLGAWSFFVNVLNLPSLVLMFLGQWAYGVVRHPDYPSASVWQAIEAFSRDAALSRRAGTR